MTKHAAARMRNRTRWRARALAACLGAMLLARGAAADGGSLCASEVEAGLRVSVFLDPTPLRVGPAEIGVLVQGAADDRPIPAASVRLRLSRPGNEAGARELEARIGTAANRLLHAATTSLDASGALEIEVHVSQGGHDARVRCSAEVGAGAPPLLVWWPLLALPPAAVALFATHQVLAGRLRARRAGHLTPPRPRW